MAGIALVMFPLNLLLAGKSPSRALLSALLFGLPALLAGWTPKDRKPGRSGAPKRMPHRAKVGLGIFAAVLLCVMFVEDVCDGGFGIAITNMVGFILVILVATLGYKLGYLKF